MWIVDDCIRKREEGSRSEPAHHARVQNVQGERKTGIERPRRRRVMLFVDAAAFYIWGSSDRATPLQKLRFARLL